MKNIILLILISLAPLASKADTLLVHVQPNKTDRIVLFDGKYFMHLQIYLETPDTNLYVVKFNGGTFGKDGDGNILLKAGTNGKDTLFNKYFTWPPLRIGPDFSSTFMQDCRPFFNGNAEIVNISGAYYVSYICKLNRKNEFRVKRLNGTRRLGKFKMVKN